MGLAYRSDRVQHGFLPLLLLAAAAVQSFARSFVSSPVAGSLSPAIALQIVHTQKTTHTHTHKKMALDLWACRNALVQIHATIVRPRLLQRLN